MKSPSGAEGSPIRALPGLLGPSVHTLPGRDPQGHGGGGGPLRADHQGGRGGAGAGRGSVSQPSGGIPPAGQWTSTTAPLAQRGVVVFTVHVVLTQLVSSA